MRCWNRWLMIATVAALGMNTASPNVSAAPETVESLIKKLDSRDQGIRLAAVMALGEMGPKAGSAVPALIDAMKTGDEDMRLNVCLTLGRIGKTAIPIAKLVNDKDAGLRFYACWTLGLIGPEARGTAKVVAAALADTQADVRRKAAYALNRIDPELAAVGPGLVESLGDSDADVRAEAADAVKRFGPKVVPFLAEGIRKSQRVRSWALAVLNQIPADGATVVGAFAPFLREQESALQQIGGDVIARYPKSAIPPLLTMLSDADERVRLEALRVLTSMPADAPLLLPTLKNLAGAKAPSLRESALVLLGRLGGDGVPHLIDGLSDADAGVRWTAAHSLGKVGTAAANAIPALTRAAKDSDPDVRNAAKESLAKIRGSRPR